MSIDTVFHDPGAQASASDNVPGAQGIMGGRGRGGGAQDNDRAFAEGIGSEVCNADLLEFQRLIEQLGEIREWLQT